MLYRDICRTLSFYLWILILPLSIPLCIAIYCDWIVGPDIFPQPPSALAFIYTILTTLILGAILWLVGRKSTGHLYRREGLLLVILIYFVTPAIGGLPFFLNRTLENPLDCYFEAISGLTTTGATIMQAKKYDPTTGKEVQIKKTVEAGALTTYSFYGNIKPVIDPITNEKLEGLSAVSYSLLFWRSFMQWLGGGGIIVLFVAILPALGVGGKILFQTEVTGPSKESIFPRIKDTASQLWKIYLALTVLEIILLVATNHEMPVFDAVTISFSTISTGGFTPHSGGINHYHNLNTDLVIMVFMILGSISFSLYFFCMRGRFFRLNDPELKAFLAIIFVSCLIATWQLSGAKRELIDIKDPTVTLSWWEALRYGSFQIISAQTSTGFSTANYDLWPFSVQVLMLILFYVGGMAGSTAGGIKVVRQQTFFRIMLNKIESIYRPDTVRTYRVGTSVVDNRTATTILCFFMIVAGLTIIGTFIFVLVGIDPETSLSSIACMLNNVGIAFRMAGPTEGFAFLPPLGKIISCVWMIAGRLEYFALLMVLVPAFWRTTY